MYGSKRLFPNVVDLKGKMKQGCFWPTYGEDDEIVFAYSDSRGRTQIEVLLGQSFQGTILMDG